MQSKMFPIKCLEKSPILVFLPFMARVTTKNVSGEGGGGRLIQLPSLDRVKLICLIGCSALKLQTG